MVTAQQKHVMHLVPKNGRYLVGMMVGGPADRARELRDRLAESRGILIQYHLDYEKAKAFGIDRLPEDIDFILYIKSQMGHANESQFNKAITKWVREHGGTKIPLIKTSHKWVNIDMALRKRFAIGVRDPLPLEVISTAYFRTPKAAVIEAPKAPVVEAPKVPVAAPILTTKQPEPVIIRPEPVVPNIVGDTATILRQIPLEFPADAPMKPSYETLQLIIHLQARMQNEGIQAMISPNEITISALRKA